MFPTMDADSTQRFFGHDFLHVVPPLTTLQAKILRCVVRILGVWLRHWHIGRSFVVCQAAVAFIGLDWRQNLVHR
jgi:hypothetical protein